MKHLFFSVFFLGFASLASQAQGYVPHPGNWQSKTPKELGLDAVKLQEAIRFAETHESTENRNLKIAHYESAFGREPFGYPVGPMKERGPATGLIIYKGYVVGQWGDPARVDLTFSVAKSFLSTTAGLAVEAGLIRSVQDQVHPYMAPIYPYDPLRLAVNKADHLDQEDVFNLFDTPHNQKITWDNLLRQTSDWEGSLWGKPDWGDRPAEGVKQKRSRDQREPGSSYEYNDTRVNVLALATTAVWHRPLPEVLREYIMEPIGASNQWHWTGYRNSWIVMDGKLMQSVSGGGHFGGGLFISAIDMARFGLLTLHKGKWGNKQLIPEQWMDLSTRPTTAEPEYGFMNYFLNTDQKLFPAAPASAFAHIGNGTNMIYVDREHELVVVGRWIENKSLNDFLQRVLQAVQQKK
jgi:CubicO group peptidase (beta-lactamase class C family)